MKLTMEVYIFAILGLLLGVWLDVQIYSDNLHIISYVFPTLFASIFALTFNNKNNLRLILSSSLVALFLSLPILPFNFGEEPANVNHVICFLVGYPLFIFITHCFHYAYHNESSYKISYKSLFAVVWNTFPILLLSMLFVALTQIIFMLGAYVYKSVGNDFLWQLYFDDMHFRIITNSLFFFIGLSICQKNLQVIYSLRVLVIKAMYYLLPFLALISISYFFFIFTNTLLYKQSIPINLNVLVPLIFLGIIFFNAYTQDSDENFSSPTIYSRFVKFYRIVLFALSCRLITYVFQDFTFDVNILVYLFCGLGLTFVYFITIFFPREIEFKYIKLGNIYIALIYIIALFILNIPYLPINFMRF